MQSIGILASYNGSGFEALYKATQKGSLHLQFPAVISNNSNAQILQKATQYGIDSYIINSKTDENPDQKIYELLKKSGCEFVFLSGYMKKLSPLLTNNFTIINSHPSLLPQYGGVGMYGGFVHEAVIQNKEKKSGVTLHYVNENYDEGEFILQKELFLSKDETPQSLEEKVKSLEKEAIVEAFIKLTSSQ